MRLFFILCMFSTVITTPTWRTCSFCQKIINDANDYFGDNVTSTTDKQFAAYFKIKCPKYIIISPIMEIICEEMVSTHPIAVFSGLHQQTDPQAICQKCQDC